MEGIPPQYDAEGAPVEESTELEIGQEVLVIITEWNKVTGEVTAHDSTGITLQWEEGSDIDDLSLAWDQVRQVQIQNRKGVDLSILSFAVAVVLVAGLVDAMKDLQLVDMN